MDKIISLIDVLASYVKEYELISIKDPRFKKNGELLSLVRGKQIDNFEYRWCIKSWEYVWNDKDKKWVYLVMPSERSRSFNEEIFYSLKDAINIIEEREWFFIFDQHKQTKEIEINET